MAGSDEPPRRRYTEEEVAKILRRALERQLTAGQMDHGELVEVAREVGISPQELEAAAAEVVDKREQGDDEREARARIAARRRGARRGFAWHLAVFILVNLFLFAIDILTTGGIWFFFPLLAWGLGLALHGVALAMHTDDLDAEVRRIRAVREKQARKAAVRSGKPGEALERSARELGQTVEHGVATLLEAAARKIQLELEATARQRESAAAAQRGTTGVRAAPDESRPAAAPGEPVEREAERAAGGEAAARRGGRP